MAYKNSVYKVDITSDMREKSWIFAEKIIIGDNQYNRLLPAEVKDDKELADLIRIQRTYVGKLAECIFLQYLQDNGVNYDDTGMFDIWEGQINVDKYDFITKNNKKVDVKAAYRSNHYNLVINREQFENDAKDFYVGIKLNAKDSPVDKKNLIIPDSITIGQIFGYAERSFLERLDYHNLGESDCKKYPLKRLLNIKRLIKLF